MKSRKIQSLFLVLVSLVFAGCATTQSNRQTDIDALNAKIASLQSELAEKDAEMARLSNQMKSEESARMQAENERRMLSDKLDNALAKLEANKAKVSRPDSDLK